MKAVIHKLKGQAGTIAAIVVMALFVCSFLLYQENRAYQRQNRELVVQNDSILAENIGLRQALKQVQTTAVPIKSSLSFKVPE